MSDEAAPGILGLPIDYYKFKRWNVKNKVTKKLKEDEPGISQEKLQAKLAEWEKSYDKWEERDYKKWKEEQERG